MELLEITRQHYLDQFKEREVRELAKKKVFELSIINKTHTKSALDITHFYTSDTALELVFRLIEKEYTFDSVEVLLLNVDDRSVVTRSVTKSEDWYSYELDDDIVAHYGQWKGQLQLKKGAEIYVSSPFNFRIENDLQNDRPPQLTEVNNWKNLRTIADELIADLRVELQSAIDKGLAIENGESERQSTFETNESKRYETFESNETTRQGNETARQQAESQRQSTFETNESERQTTFETAEQLRQKAEIIRVDNETSRVERDANRETEISQIKDDVVYYGAIKLVNLLENGDFSKGYTSWEKHGDVVLNSVDDYINVQTTRNYTGIYQNNLIMTNTNKYYGYCYVKSTEKVQLNTANSSVGVFNTGENFSFISTIFEKKAVIFSSFGVALVTPGVLSIKDIGLIDLTKIFGAGNEPSKKIMDWIISENGYFDELTLRRDDLQQYEINQLRKAVIALGGTI